MQKSTKLLATSVILGGLAGLMRAHHKKVTIYGDGKFESHANLAPRQNLSLDGYLHQAVNQYDVIEKIKYQHHTVVVYADFNALLDARDKGKPFDFTWFFSNVKWAALNSNQIVKKIVVLTK